jgi:hypothetical protein
VSYEVSPPRRPGVVTAASYLLFLVAVVIIVDAVIGLSTASAVKDATAKAYQSAGIANADQVANFATVGATIGAVVYLLLAIGMVILGVLDLRGKNPARIVTWVLAGIGVLCFCFASVGSAASGALVSSAPSSPNGVSASDLAKQIKDAEPSWLQPTQTALAALSLLALILVIILLALPASNRFFRKAPVADGGVAPFQQFPQQSPYPQPPAGNDRPYPGQPPAGNDPPYPGQPPA